MVVFRASRIGQIYVNDEISIAALPVQGPISMQHILERSIPTASHRSYDINATARTVRRRR